MATENLCIENLLKKATNGIFSKGDPESQCILGLMFVKGKKVTKNDKTAFEWFLRAAQQGHATAQFNLGRMFENGKGIPKDVKKAFEWYKLAAIQGHADAQCILGVMYLNGLRNPLI